MPGGRPCPGLVLERNRRTWTYAMEFDQNCFRRGYKGQMMKGFEYQPEQYRRSAQVPGRRRRVPSREGTQSDRKMSLGLAWKGGGWSRSAGRRLPGRPVRRC